MKQLRILAVASLWIALLLVPGVAAACQEVRLQPAALAIDIGNYQLPTNYSVQLFLQEDPVAMGARCSVRWTISEQLPAGISLQFNPSAAVGSAATYTTEPVPLTITVRASGANAPATFTRFLNFVDESSNLSARMALNFRVGVTVTPTPYPQASTVPAALPTATPAPAKPALIEQLVVLLDARVIAMVAVILAILFLAYFISRKPNHGKSRESRK